MAATAAAYAPDLPHPVIHRIQSLLNPNQAARTTLLSKPWFRAWSTRPIIDLDEFHFPRNRYSTPYAEIDGLAVFAKKTFRRYKDQNLRIHTFILSLESEWYCRLGLATNWTNKALKLGATDFTFRIKYPAIVAIPMQVVLESENVVRRLCLEQACIGQVKVIRCMRLKSLYLSVMELSSATFLDIISCCPSIESLSLSEVWIAVDKDYKQPAGSMISLLNLTSLSMFCGGSEFRKLFPDNCLVSMFPNLKDLTLNLGLRREADREILVISSCSLETLNLTVDESSGARLEINVPRIRKFMFEGSVMPKFSFRSESRDQLESRVSIMNHDELSIAWFYKLSDFLTSMAGSRIYLSLHLHTKSSFNYLPGDIKCLNVCGVEDLIVDTRGLPTLSLYAVLDVLFRICHPKTITQHSSPLEKEFSCYHRRSCVICDGARENITRNNDTTLCRLLEQGMEGKDALLPHQFMYCLQDLEELNVQKLFNEVWMPQPLDSRADNHQRRFRFQLKWKSNIS